MKSQSQATTPTSSKQTSKEREEQYGSSSLQEEEEEEEELLDVYMQDSWHDSTRLPPVLRASLVGDEDGSLEQAAAGPAELCKPVSGDRKRIVPPENHDRRPDHCPLRRWWDRCPVGPTPATARVGPLLPATARVGP
ncbi:unnamed protein product [Sphagnum jensenii]|uniref:Uncharacterized protein n=1 Tax=Sphagnum jensenii TaxID=128206 RepID=A0ABP1AGV5_9BRYO